AAHGSDNAAAEIRKTMRARLRGEESRNMG
ncbi:MAG: hypothetical protein JWR73_2431, partial [Tardiphaga sp.]|nr:hypothetical protein [Tardiphaga sp.]